MFGVECSVEVPHRNAHFDEGYRDRRLDPDNHGLGAEEPHHRNDPGDYSGDERVDYGKAAYVEKDPRGVGSSNFGRELAFHLQHGRVVDLALERHEERRADPHYRDNPRGPRLDVAHGASPVGALPVLA